jgi:fatty-acyl-CoA synthase
MHVLTDEPSAPKRLTTSYWPADTAEPLLETAIGGALRETAATVPDHVGLVAAWPGEPSHRRWTFAQLLEEAERTARAMLSRFEPGERIAVWAPNIPEWLFVFFGAALARLTLVTVNPALRARELAHVLGQSRAAGLFLVPEYRGTDLLAMLDEVRPNLPALRDVVLLTDWQRFAKSTWADAPLPDVKPDDNALIVYTSGTTGVPKGALLHHRSLTNSIRLLASTLGAQVGDGWLNELPLFHLGGIIGTLAALQHRAKQVLCPVDPALMLELIETERPAIVGGTPTMLELLLRHPDFDNRDLSSVRIVPSSGMKVPADLVRRVESRLGVSLHIMYGQTEASVVTAVRGDDPMEAKLHTVGRPLPHVEVEVVHPHTGAILPLGTAGELCVRGYQVMAGYFEMPEATAAAIEDEGWLHTGDLASMDELGYCRIEGRLKEMIIRGGENIFPAEIEAVIGAHPDVAEVAVVGLPDELYGEQVAACVQLRPGASVSEAELRIFCEQQLARFKVPVRWQVLGEMPRTPLGKIQKFVLQAMLRGGESLAHLASGTAE